MPAKASDPAKPISTPLQTSLRPPAVSVGIQPAINLVEPEKSDAIAALPKPAALQPSTADPAPAVTKALPKVARTPDYVFVTGSRVNLRQGPSTKDPIVGGFDRRTKLILLESFGDWSKVSGSDGGIPKSGWMASRYLSGATPQKSAPAAQPVKRQVTVPSLREVAEARQALIRQSIVNYSGNCPCPYNRDRANRRCGKRSAWSKPGGYAPLCYESDINRSRLTAYFARKGQIWP